MALDKVMKVISTFVEGTWLYRSFIRKKKRSSEINGLTADRTPPTMRQGVSQHVLDTAERLMKEYQSDLDYLKDR